MAPAKNRWTRALEQKASTLSALAMFGVYVSGGILLIASTLAGMVGVLRVIGAIGDGWGSRFWGLVLTLGSAVVFMAGRWATNQYATQQRW